MPLAGTWLAMERAMRFAWLAFALSLAVATLSGLAGCESCEFTYGSLPVSGTASATVPIVNLRVRTCASPQGTSSCEEGYLTPLTDKQLQFDAGVPSEGGLVGSCEYVKHYLVVTADNCATQALDVLTATAGSDGGFDLVLACQ